MILVDTSLWVDHLRNTEKELVIALLEQQVLHHPFVTAELALGSISNRARLIQMLRLLPQMPTVDETELLDYVEKAELAGTGIGMVDAHLLASAAATAGARLWTRDKRLLAQAQRLGLAHRP